MIMNYTIAPEDDGKMIKRVIRGRMQISHHQFSAAKGNGGLLLDGERVFANHIVRAGQVITVLVEEERASAVPDDAPIDIVYEDEDIIIVNKPAPLACQCSPKQPESRTLENRMAHRYPDRPFRPINRLDKGTSGLMVCAHNAHAQMLLARQLHTEAFVREYLAVVVGIAPERGMVDAPIAKGEGATVKRVVSDAGKCAVTRFERVWENGAISVMRLRLETGRTHQIRVHMAHIGHPVFGDFLYGEERADVLPGRFALHAWTVRFSHPRTGKIMQFEANLPPEIEILLQE